jgi:hypothetical protein
MPTNMDIVGIQQPEFGTRSVPSAPGSAINTCRLKIPQA